MSNGGRYDQECTGRDGDELYVLLRILLQHHLIMDIPSAVAAWKHRYASRCLSIVHEQAFGARCTNYKMIQDLDKKVRNFYVPPSLRVPGFGGKMDMNAAPPTIELTMQRHIAFTIREISEFPCKISAIHRGSDILCQRCSICTEASLPKRLKTIPKTRLEANMRLHSWPPTAVHVRS